MTKRTRQQSRRAPTKKLNKDTMQLQVNPIQTKLLAKPVIKAEPDVDEERDNLMRRFKDHLPRIRLARVKTELVTLTADLIADAIANNEEVSQLASELTAVSGESQADMISRLKTEVCEMATDQMITVKIEEDELKRFSSGEARLKVTRRPRKPAAGESQRSTTQLDGERPFECSFCSKAFKRRAHLQTHENGHRGIKPFKCRHCDRAFTDRNAQICHERLHEGVKPYSCDECDRKFTQRSDYVKHSRTHTGERTHHCRYCDAKFIGSSNLIVHERGHTGERPHKCGECNAMFSKHGDLTRHRRIHTGERPYACKYCSDRFTQPAHRRVHEMAHLNEKPHHCRFCNTSFLRIGDLNRHERRHPQFTGTLKRRNEIKRVNQTEIESTDTIHSGEQDTSEDSD